MPIAAVISGQIYAVHSDHLNTPRRLTDGQGQVVWQWAYTAFGDEKPTFAKYRFANPDAAPHSGMTSYPEVVFNLRWPGQYYDQESGLHYNYFRTLDPRTGRYTQFDPVGLWGGPNGYTYASANPLNRSDPLGLADYGGLPVIEGHLRWLATLQGDSFLKSPFWAAEREMLNRLKRGEETEWDVAFYRHEMAEAAECRSALALPFEEAKRKQTEAHHRVLRDHRNTERDLYHPDVIRKFPGLFNQSWSR